MFAKKNNNVQKEMKPLEKMGGFGISVSTIRMVLLGYEYAVMLHHKKNKIHQESKMRGYGSVHIILRIF